MLANTKSKSFSHQFSELIGDRKTKLDRLATNKQPVHFEDLNIIPPFYEFLPVSSDNDYQFWWSLSDITLESLGFQSHRDRLLLLSMKKKY